MGNPPASLMMFVNTLVPYVGSASPVTGCFFRPSTKILLAALNFSGSFGVRILFPVSSRTITLIPLDPITAPVPPRPACLVGLSSISVHAIVAALIFISPAGPMEIVDILSLYSFFILSTTS